MMPGIHPVTDERTVPDVFVQGLPCQITLATTFFRLKHLAAWGAEIELHPWDSWDRLGDRLGARLGRHIWHPDHWTAYYAALPDIPASTPGAVPLTRAMVRERRRTRERQLALLEDS